MNGTNSLPNDLTECHQLLLAACKQSVQLEQRAEQAQRCAAESDRQAAELNRVLDETAASFEELKQEHAVAARMAFQRLLLDVHRRPRA